MDTWKVHPIRWVGYSSIYSSELHAVVQELELELVSGAGIGAGVGVGELRCQVIRVQAVHRHLGETRFTDFIICCMNKPFIKGLQRGEDL